jgi:hypothetical protein
MACALSCRISGYQSAFSRDSAGRGLAALVGGSCRDGEHQPQSPPGEAWLYGRFNYVLYRRAPVVDAR